MPKRGIMEKTNSEQIKRKDRTFTSIHQIPLNERDRIAALPRVRPRRSTAPLSRLYSNRQKRARKKERENRKIMEG